MVVISYIIKSELTLYRKGGATINIYATELYHALQKAHPDIWQVKDYPLLLLEYEVCENCEQREHELLADYKKENGTYPLANWRG